MGKQRKKAKEKAAAKTRVQAPSMRRNFDGGIADRLTASWTTTEQTVNSEIYHSLKQIRARSRDLYQNNEYGKHFFSLVVGNVVGAHGIGFQSKVKKLDGEMVKRDNELIEARFKDFSKAGQFDVTRKLSRCQAERLFVLSVAMDGEALVRKVPGYANEQRYALQFLDPARLDVDFNQQPRGELGHIVMGVEMDDWGAPVAYHLLSKLPNEWNPALAQSAERVRVPANEIIHAFVPYRPGQVRGMPWVHAGMRALHQLGDYRGAAVVAAGVGAAKIGIWSSTDGQGAPSSSKQNGHQLDDVKAGQFYNVPEGTTLSTWDPTYPHEQFGEFNKAMLRGLAGAFGVAYFNLNNDMESVNLSSARIGQQHERDFYKSIQRFTVETFCDDYYPEWLAMNIPMMGLPMSRFDRLNAPSWRPRTWPSPDPMKDAQTNALNVGMNFTSPQRVIIGQGDDPEEILAEIGQWNKRLAELGIQPMKPSQIGPVEEPEEDEPEPVAEPDPDEDEDEDEDEEDEPAARSLSIIKGAAS